MVLYHCIAARSFRPLWTLEELGLDYDLRVLPFPPRAHDKSYLETNPLGTVPAFIDGATRMTESAAMCQFLADRHPAAGLNVLPAEEDYGAYLNFLHFGEATLTFPQTLILRYGKFEPAERQQPQVVADYEKWFLSRLRSLAPRLEQAAFLCAGRFTVADISVGYALLLARYLGLEAGFPAPVAEYWQRLSARAGYTRALRAELDAAAAQGVSLVPAPQMAR